MAYVEDVALSNATSLSQALQANLTYKAGNKFKVLGSGTLNATLNETLDSTGTNAADAKAVAATAKSDYGPASADAAMQSSGGALGSGGSLTSGGLPPWVLYAALGLAALVAITFSIKNLRK